MTDADYQKLQEFQREFKMLVRKYMPDYPSTDSQAELLTSMQDSTSCYSPFVWSA